MKPRAQSSSISKNVPVSDSLQLASRRLARRLLVVCCGALLGSAGLVMLAASAAPSTKPNIIYVLCDDLG